MIGRTAIKAYLFAAAMLAATSCAFGEDLQKIKIVTSSSSIPGSTARFVKEMGFFGKHGLDASISAMDTNSVAASALISGSANFATTPASDLIVSQTRGQDLVALFSAYRDFAAVLVIARSVADKLKISPTAPVQERLKALDGLAIAAPSPTSSFTAATRSSVESVGAKVTLVYMSNAAMVAALQSGALQGFVASAPYYVQPVLNGSGVIWIAGPKGEFPPQFSPANSNVLMTTRSYAAANPDVMKRVVAAFADFGRAATDRPADVKAAIARLSPDVEARTLDLILETEARGFAVGPLTAADIAHDIAFVKASGVDLAGIDKINPATLIFQTGR
jgi:ABC-type nitrate/sulfonate/bicarbonate transport system substrate-binding protein